MGDYNYNYNNRKSSMKFEMPPNINNNQYTQNYTTNGNDNTVAELKLEELAPDSTLQQKDTPNNRTNGR